MSIEFIDFYADWCGPCIVMKPVIEELEKDFAGKLQIRKVDVDKELSETTKFGVMSIPTYVLVKDGREVERFVGATSKESIKSKILTHLS